MLCIGLYRYRYRTFFSLSMVFIGLPLRTFYIHCIYYRLRNSDFSDYAAIIVPPFIISYYTHVYLLCDLIMILLAAHFLHFAFLHHENESNEATIVSCPHPKNTYHFLLFSLSIYLCHLVVYLAFSYSSRTSTSFNLVQLSLYSLFSLA